MSLILPIKVKVDIGENNLNTNDSNFIEKQVLIEIQGEIKHTIENSFTGMDLGRIEMKNVNYNLLFIIFIGC